MEGYATNVSEDGKLRLEVGLVKNDEKSTNGFLNIRVSAVEAAKRVPMNIICMIDTSGSMGVNATIQNAQGVTESTPLDMLDLARHAVLTVANGMNAEDRLSIVGWNSDPDRNALKLTKMDKAGHDAAKKYLDTLCPNYSTGMIQALTYAFQLVEDNGHPTAIFLLTDGQPDEKPKEGFFKFVSDLMEKSGKDILVNTYGFGYNVDSELLMDIAKAGHGTFAFIPDAGFLGTVMVNSLANTVLAAFSNTQVSIELADGISFEKDALSLPKGSLSPAIRNADGSVVLNIGAVAYEQPRSVVLPVVIAPTHTADKPVVTVAVNCLESGKKVNVVLDDAVTQVLPSMRFSYAESVAARAKTLFADSLMKVIGDTIPSDIKGLLANATKEFKSCAEILKSFGDDARIVDIVRDCEGQACEAVSKPEWFNRWGRHYLRSLCVAHEYEICNNFKDPGVQHYGGKLFASIRDSLDDIFQSLPPPTANRPQYASRGFGRGPARAARAAPSTFSMRSFMDVNSGCFAGSCTVSMADGSNKRVSDVRKGDVVRTGASSDTTATVVCVVEHPTPAEVCVLSPSGLIITPWHPVDVDGKDVWSFPANCANVSSAWQRICIHFCS